MLRSSPRIIAPGLALLAAGLITGSCAKSGDTQSSGAGSASGGSGPASGGSSGSNEPAGTPPPSGGSGPSIVIPDAQSVSQGDACQHLDVQFLPRIPLVFVLADRSGSEFDTIQGADGGNTNEWTPLRAATLAVIQSLDSQVAFGFGAYTGINPSTTPMMCPIFDSVPTIQVNNYQTIAALYSSLMQPMFKAETPAELTLETKVAPALIQAAATMADAGGAQPGGMYILFVTDGETDFCDDGNAVCPADAVLAELQRLYTMGIQTLILGIGSSLTSISGAVLQDFANAGVGLPVSGPPSGSGQPPLQPADIYNQCQGVAGWNQLWTKAGLTTGQALATYGTPTTNATLYSPNVATNVTQLTAQLAQALSTVKTCSFDLQGKIMVDLANANEGLVTIDGTAIPYDATNGWTMTTPTELDLTGAACQTWRATGMNISFDFPCQIIVQVAK